MDEVIGHRQRGIEMETMKVSNNMLARMPIYLNYIKSLPKDTKNISATKIANALGFGEVSVRKDLAKVSDGGRCKLGYCCEELISDIETFLGVKSTLKGVIVGNAEMLQSLLEYSGFDTSGLCLVAGFALDYDEKGCMGSEKIYPIEKLESVCAQNNVQVGIMMTSTKDAQSVCDKLVLTGVEGIWNFTPVHLNVPENVVIQNESFIASITKLRMQLKEKEELVL